MKNKTVLASLLLFSVLVSPVFGKNFNSDIHADSVNFDGRDGTAYFNHMKLRTQAFSMSLQNQEWNINIEQNNLSLSHNETHISLHEIDQSMLGKLDFFSASNLRVIAESERSVSIMASTVDTGLSSGLYHASELEFNCQNLVAIKFDMASCLESGSLSMSKFSLSKAQVQSLMNSLLALSSQQADNEFEKISLELESGNFQLSMKVKKGFASGSLKSAGHIEWDQTQRLFIVRIDKLRVGWFGVRGKFFDLLEKLNIENIEIINDSTLKISY